MSLEETLKLPEGVDKCRVCRCRKVCFLRRFLYASGVIGQLRVAWCGLGFVPDWDKVRELEAKKLVAVK